MKVSLLIDDRLFQIVYGGMVHEYLGSIIDWPSTMTIYSHLNLGWQANGGVTMDLTCPIQVVEPLWNASICQNAWQIPWNELLPMLNTSKMLHYSMPVCYYEPVSSVNHGWLDGNVQCQWPHQLRVLFLNVFMSHNLSCSLLKVVLTVSS